MRYLIPWVGTLALACGLPSTALAQANANAVVQATDAFGFRSGDDAVGIYDESSVRGFSLESAGNYRIDGTYFVRNSGVSTFFLESTTVRIGLNTLNSILPGPSGVVDYRLRDPQEGEPGTLTVGLDAYSQSYAELHFKHRDPRNRFSLSAGVGRVFDIRDEQGGHGGESLLVAGAGRLNLGKTTARLFFGEYQYQRLGQFRVTSEGETLPPEIRRGRFLGQRWAMAEGQRRIAGALFDSPLFGGAGVGATVVFSQEDPSRSFTQIFSNLRPDGTARATVIATPQQRSTAWSGELRAHAERSFGELANRLDLTVRLRRSRSRFGGSEIVDLGRVDFGEPIADNPAPDLDDSAVRLRDEVDQWGIGLTYRASLRDRLHVNLGLLKTDYRKVFTVPGEPRQTGKATPWLYNLGASWRIAKNLELYGSYSRGLEEAGIAPATAANRYQVLNAIFVTQRELGVRYMLHQALALVIAGFDTQKPYVGVDSSSGIYGFLGRVRHRGVEASLSGRPLTGLSLVLGGVLIDPEITSDEDTASSLGRRPVGVPRRRGIASIDYQLPMIDGLSLDASAAVSGKRPVRSSISLLTGEQLETGGMADFSFGMRYRFKVAGRELIARAQVLNAFNKYQWDVNSSETLSYSPPRRFKLVLTSLL